MDKETLLNFNKELTALLEKYNVVLTVEEIPATKRISVATKPQVESEATTTPEVDMEQNKTATE